MSVLLDKEIYALVEGEKSSTFSFNLEEIPEKPTLEMFDFLMTPNAPESAEKAVKAIYSMIFWDKWDGKNANKIRAAMTSQQLLTRWIKERADLGLSVFDELSDLAKRSNMLFQIAYERSGLQLVPDEHENIYESFSEMLREKLGTSQSIGEKSELAWAVKELIPRMKSMGLDIAPLIAQPTFYTKFRHFVQTARQQDRLVDAVSRRFDDEKRLMTKKLARVKADTPEHEKLIKELIRVINTEQKQKTAQLESYESVVVNGMNDVLDPSVSVRDIDKKYRLQYEDMLGEIIKGTGYSAIIHGQKTILIAEFDYSLLDPIAYTLAKLVDIKGMTDPILIIRQLREYADELERTMGGG